jgi:hypothetical protein
MPIYVACVWLLLFRYESVHLQMYLSVYVLYIYFQKSSVCIYFNCMQFKNFMWHSQLDVGYVTVCSVERRKAFSRVAWLDLGGRGCYNMVSKL